ncbi:MAG: right-handed parallel beta-helix repeat-containing protein [Dehalococcoidia bacterium]|nr:right-handed parallel beta-helix repeat-containing protein [Dehalococcoidia bacterium]
MRNSKLIGKVFGTALVFVLIVSAIGDLPGLASGAEASPGAIYVPDDCSTIQNVVSDAKADTWVEGHIIEDTTWTLANSPYLVTGDVFVDEGITLTIEPGVIVKFGGFISIYVSGDLYAVGTSANKITFTSNKLSPEMGDWNTIKFQGDEDETLIMKYVMVEYGTYGVTISSIGDSLIDFCEFYNNAKGIYVISQTNTQIKNNTIKLNQIGISSEGEEVSDITVVSNIISNNTGRGIYLLASNLHDITITGNAIRSNKDSGIYLKADAYHSYIWNVTISDNAVSLNGGSGIYLNAYSFYYDSPCSYINDTTIIGNTVFSNSGSGIYLYAPTTYTHSYIYDVTISDNNVYSNNGSGLYLYDESRSSNVYDVTIVNNTVSSNSGSGIYFYVYSAAFLGESCSYTYNITISDNTASSNGDSGIYLYIPSYYSYTYNIIISDNTASSNDGSGIYLYAPASYYSYIYGVIISNNTASSNGGSGIRTHSTRHYTEVEFDITMHNNYVYSNNHGIYISGGSKTHITNSSIHTNALGVLYDRTTGNFASFNNVYQNDYGMNVTNGATVKAEQNYWGDPSGPYHVSMNPYGKGNPVNGNGADLDFIPFFSSPVEDDTTPPNCVIELRGHGINFQIDRVDVGEFFDIYVGVSTDDTGITKIRFSSDDSQDNTPTGEWTEWYDWDISLGDWDAATKIKGWCFATGGKKEVWAEVKDDAGQTDAEAANVKTAYTPDPCGYRFINRGVQKNIWWTPTNEGLSESTKERIFDEVFDQGAIKDDDTKMKLMDEFGLGPKDASFSGGNCYGMAVSSLMEYGYPDHDPFGLGPQEGLPIYELNKDGQDPQEVIQDGHTRWDASDANGGIVENPVLERILKFQVSQFGLPNQNNKSDYSANPTALVPFLSAEINNNKMYVVLIGYYESKGWWIFKSYDYHGHALIPYRVDQAENRIYVYDCNHPADLDYFIDVSGGKWEYNLGWTTWPPDNAVDAGISIVPVDTLYDDGLQTVVPMGGDIHGAAFFMEGDGNLVLSDSEGRITGFVEGIFLKELPGVERVDRINALTDENGDYLSQQIYFVDDDKQLTSTVQGTGPESYSLTKFGPGYFGDVSSSFSEDGEIHTITLSSVQAKLSFSREAELEDTSLRQSGGQTTYSITLHKNTGGTGQTASVADVPVPVTSGATHDYTIDWDALAAGEAGVNIEIDSDGDGQLDANIVTSQPNIPSSPSPVGHATGVDMNADLAWVGGDPDAGDTVTYDVYFGTNSSPPFKETIGPYPATESSITCDLGPLMPGTTYYWRIVPRDNHGITREGPVWEFTVEGEEIQLSLQAGWNMVSVPVTPADNSTGAVFPGVAGIFTWDATSRSYYMPTVIDPEKGYWVAVTENTTITISGSPLETWTTDIKAGWNMIGSVNTTASIANPSDDPDGSVMPTAYWWDPESKSYVLTANIEPGKGYWLASISDCTLTLP